MVYWKSKYLEILLEMYYNSFSWMTITAMVGSSYYINW